MKELIFSFDSNPGNSILYNSYLKKEKEWNLKL